MWQHQPTRIQFTTTDYTPILCGKLGIGVLKGTASDNGRLVTVPVGDKLIKYADKKIITYGKIGTSKTAANIPRLFHKIVEGFRFIKLPPKPNVASFTYSTNIYPSPAIPQQGSLFRYPVARILVGGTHANKLNIKWTPWR